MIEIENDCVGCPQGCIRCGRKKVPHFYCDYCGEECDDLYDVRGDQFCKECTLKELQIDIVQELELD